MKFFFKYKKQIFSVFLCVVLFSCFMGFSFSSSAAEAVVADLPISGIYFHYISGGTNFLRNPSSGYYTFDKDLGYSTPTPLFSQLAFYSASSGGLYTVPEVDGRGVSLSVNLQFLLTATGYLSITPAEDILNGAIFTDCMINVYFSDGTSVYHRSYDTFLIKDDINGEILNPNSAQYWLSIAGSPANLDIYALFDLSDSMGKTIDSIYILFPSSSGQIYYSNASPVDYFAITDPSLSVSFIYSPFNNVVVDDLSDIKGSLSGVNNKLDSISSSMNTIDQDINRVNQKLEQTNETLGNIDQGIQDILKPSTPAVDFKNQWNDYFANNPVPDISALPSYDMSNMMILLADSSSIIRNIFSPFFLRDYSVLVPLTQGFSNVRLDPVATYVSLSFGLSLAVVIIGLLKGSRG